MGGLQSINQSIDHILFQIVVIVLTSWSWVACFNSCCCCAFLISCTHLASAWASRTWAAPSSFASLVQSPSFVVNSACASSSSWISSCSVRWHFKRSRRASISSACYKWEIANKLNLMIKMWVNHIHTEMSTWYCFFKRKRRTLLSWEVVNRYKFSTYYAWWACIIPLGNL